MAEQKKKQASIAAFFSPVAAREKPSSKRPRSPTAVPAALAGPGGPASKVPDDSLSQPSSAAKKKKKKKTTKANAVATGDDDQRHEVGVDASVGQEKARTRDAPIDLTADTPERGRNAEQQRMETPAVTAAPTSSERPKASGSRKRRILTSPHEVGDGDEDEEDTGKQERRSGGNRIAPKRLMMSPNESAGGNALPASRNVKPTVGGKKKKQEDTNDAAVRVIISDPLIQARINSYKAKITDLSSLCSKLLSRTEAAEDTILLDVYGLGLDQALEMEEIREPLCSSNELLRDIPDVFKCFAARFLQGRSDGLSQIVQELSQRLAGRAKDISSLDIESHRCELQPKLEMEIKMLAQRQNYGVKLLKANLYEDTTAEGLWVWEVGNLEKYFSDDSLKMIKRMRKHRKRLGQQLKTLARVVHLLEQSPVDEAKVSAEEAKIARFVVAIEQEVQRARERDRKEQEKAQQLEERKRAEEERQQAKLEEKKKKELELEQERQLSTKRKKSLVSYFRSIDSRSNLEGVEKESQPEMPVHLRAVPDKEAQAKAMLTIDREVPYLVEHERAVSESSSWTSQTSPSLIGKKGTGRAHGSTGSWGKRRRRDRELGIMKLLQFHENYRPAYFGTFSKRSRVFRRGRRPFAQYNHFDYSVDSDEEWEEEEPGESLSDADSDNDESDEDALDYGDQWLAYDDEVDYMSDTQGFEDEDDDKTSNEPKSTSLSDHHRGRSSNHPSKKSKLAKLVPQVLGPYWYDNYESPTLGMRAYLVHALREPIFESNLMKKAREIKEKSKEPEAKKSEESKVGTKGKATSSADSFTTATNLKKQPEVEKSPQAKAGKKGKTINSADAFTAESDPKKRPKVEKSSRVSGPISNGVTESVSTDGKISTDNGPTSSLHPNSSNRSSISSWLQREANKAQSPAGDESRESPQIIEIDSLEEDSEDG